jgi:hypothetical protein
VYGDDRFAPGAAQAFSSVSRPVGDCGHVIDDCKIKIAGITSQTSPDKIRDDGIAAHTHDPEDDLIDHKNLFLRSYAILRLGLSSDRARSCLAAGHA